MVNTDFFISERKWYVHTLCIILSFVLFSTQRIEAQAIACNDNVQVSLNINCEANITPALILEGEDESQLPNYSVAISGVSGTIVSSPGVYTVTVTDNTTGNNCWGQITVEDKLGPIVEDCNCPVGNTDPDCEFLCTDLQGVLDNTLGVPQPVVNENCGTYTSAYSDIISEGGCGEQIITRNWIFTDNVGNETEGCTQQFKTVPVSTADIVLPVTPVEMPCGADVSMDGIITYFTPQFGGTVAQTYAYPTVNGIAINGAVCNLISTKEDVTIPVCEESCSNSIKVIRGWTVIDWCTSEILTFNQIVKAVDTELPTITANDQSVSTDPWVCSANFFLEPPTTLHDNCTADEFLTYTVSGPAGVLINWDAQANRYFVTGAPKGQHSFIYIASDCCGNTQSAEVIVSVEDNTPPVAVAKQNIVVSLTQSASADGSAKIYANSVDNGSHDGCSDVHLEIRRDGDVCSVTGNTTYNNDGHSFDKPNDNDNGAFVKFCCNDITNAVVDVDGDGTNDPGYLMVWLRVWDDGDMNGIYGTAGDNFNETWTYVKVEDKLSPVLNCPSDITISCHDDASDLDLTGEATGSFTCTDAEVTYNDVVNTVGDCGSGFITRRWSIVGNSAVFCDQKITKSTGDLFDGTISWPGDYNTDCTDLDGNDNVPTWGDPGCSKLAYNLESDTFQFEEGACFKIINTWTVIDWCQYHPSNGSNVGIWSHVQVIKVLDDEAPILNCAPQMYAVDDHTDVDNDGDKCEVKSLMLTNIADDNGDCASAWLKWTVLVDLWGDGTYDYEFNTSLPPYDSNFNDTNGNGIPDVYVAATMSGEEVKVTLPVDVPGSMNNHKVKWKVTDGCNNITSCENTFMVVDKKKPTPYCIDVSTALMENGMVELWACDFDLGSFDNCTDEENLRYTFSSTKPQNDPNYNSNSKCSSRIFDCDDLTNSPVAVTMYVWDEKDNYDFCEVTLTLVDNHGGCEDGAGMRIEGSVHTASNTILENIEVKLTAPEIEMIKYDMTNEAGNYAFVNNPENVSYQITAVGEQNYLDGVSTLDLVMIQRHILGLSELNDAYKVVAADINNDERLSASDLLQLRKLILGIITELPSNNSYVFVDGGQEITEVNDPWPVNKKINVANLQGDMNAMDFVAIKVGDVNSNATYGNVNANAIVPRSEKDFEMVAEIEKAENTVININTANAAKVYGLQVSLDITGMSNIEIKKGSMDIDVEHYSIEGNTLHISWSVPSGMEVIPSEPLFSIEGISQETTVSIGLNSEGLTGEAYVDGLKVAGIELATRVDLENESNFVVLQNEPNPFSDKTTIIYELPSAGNVSLTVSDISGKVVYTDNANAPSGKGRFIINGSLIGTSGVYYYKVTSGEYTLTNKMVLVK